MDKDDFIKNISYSNSEILKNIINLHNNGEPLYCDMTYSKGMFYSNGEICQPIIKFDTCPLFDDVKKIEPNGGLPFEDNSIPSIVIDLPFCIAPKEAPSRITTGETSNNIMLNRFSSYYPINELLENYNHWIQEAYRVLKRNGICVFTCQSNVSGGKQLWSEEYSWLCAVKAGFYVIDKFILLSKGRLISGKYKKQYHARRFTSVFYVFKKTGNKNIDYFRFLVDKDKKGNDTND